MNQIEKFNLAQFLNGGKGLDTVTLKVRHGQENDIVINANAWCDIGGHKVPEDSLQNIQGDALVCEDCFEHFS